MLSSSIQENFTKVTKKWKDALASQPTVSRFYNRMEKDTLNQFLAVGKMLRKKIYSIQMPQAMWFGWRECRFEICQERDSPSCLHETGCLFVFIGILQIPLWAWTKGGQNALSDVFWQWIVVCYELFIIEYFGVFEDYGTIS